MSVSILVRKCVLLFALTGLCARAVAEAPKVDEDGKIHVPAFEMPESAMLSAETRAALKQARVFEKQYTAAMNKCPPLDKAAVADMPAIRKCQADGFYRTGWYKSVRDQYPVSIESRTLGGVGVEIFTPTQGITSKNETRVLINVHGGGFTLGSRTVSQLESIPIAALGRIKVVSVDYRMAPEKTFPAGSEDVAAVYRELLRSYAPRNIGVYGCSAGGALVSQAMALFMQQKLPLPAAIGLFCNGADHVGPDGVDKWAGSDGARFGGMLLGYTFKDPHPYYKGVDRSTPLASPGNYDDVMAKFPPTLLISGTRDFLLSQVLVTHAQLVRLGVEADLHVWEGMWHAFHFYPALPESREAYDVIVRFFDTHLGPR